MNPASQSAREALDVACHEMAELVEAMRRQAAEFYALGDRERFRAADSRLSQLEEILADLKALKSRFEAIWTRGDGTISSARPSETSPPLAPAHPPGRAGREIGLPEREYVFPLLEALVELGGEGSSEQVLQLVHQKVKHKLRPEDYEALQSTDEERWRNKARWVRKYLTDGGYMSQHTPRGWWKITDKGRTALRERDLESLWRILMQYKQATRRR